MTKRKKATSAASRTSRGGHLLDPQTAAATARTRKTPASAEQPAIPVTTTPVAATTVAALPAPTVSTTLTLAPECLVSDALRLKESLRGLLDEPHPVTLDITALQRIDTAALQVITAFVRHRAGHGLPIEWQGSAPALTSAAQLLGLTSLLRLPA